MKSLRLFAFAALLLPVLVFSGCAHYKHGGLMHPQVHTIAILPLQNDTMQPRLEIQARNKLRSAFAKDGSLIVVEDPATADCILRARITSADYSSRGTVENQSADKDQRVYTTNVFGVSIAIDYVVELADGETILVSPRRVVGTSEFNELPDLEISRRDALSVAVSDAADRLVYGITEAW